MRTASMLRPAGLFASLATAAMLVIGGASPVSANGDGGVAPLGTCVKDPGTYYLVSSKQDKIFLVGMHYKGGPGGTVTASTQYSLSVSATISLAVSFSVNAVVASAQTTYGISATASASVGQTWSHTWPVTAGKYGHVQWGNWGWSMNLKKEVITNSCAYSSWNGSASIPSVDTWGYKYWETSS